MHENAETIDTRKTTTLTQEPLSAHVTTYYDVLSARVQVEDPRTSRYVGASYVNIASLGREVCAEMLENQVPWDSPTGMQQRVHGRRERDTQSGGC